MTARKPIINDIAFAMSRAAIGYSSTPVGQSTACSTPISAMLNGSKFWKFKLDPKTANHTQQHWKNKSIDMNDGTLSLSKPNLEQPNQIIARSRLMSWAGLVSNSKLSVGFDPSTHSRVCWSGKAHVVTSWNPGSELAPEACTTYELSKGVVVF